MTDDAARAQRLLAVLRERPHSVDTARAENRRARVVPYLQEHLVRVARSRRRARRLRFATGTFAALLAAATVVLFAVRREVTPAFSEIRAVQGRLVHSVSGQDHTVLAGDRLAIPVDGELHTDETSGASLETANGLRLDLDASSEVSLVHMAGAAEHRVELLGGQLACAVPKLDAGSSFAVVTPNARVVVHGTKFTVRVDSPQAGVTRTCVRVREGLVAVHHAAGTAMLHAGESWGCPEAPATVVRADAPARIAVNEARHDVRPKRVAHPVAVVAPPDSREAPEREGTLAKETALLQTALAAEHRGHRDTAMAALTKLLSTYPESPLLPEARAALERVAVASDSSP
ncbi:MAG TPA: FecR domain-containing protein [Polyangiaceae bacterium]|nr:FecR domain-containing protein [Polyangiaceae bacterium]